MIMHLPNSRTFVPIWGVAKPGARSMKRLLLLAVLIVGGVSAYAWSKLRPVSLSREDQQRLLIEQFPVAFEGLSFPETWETDSYAHTIHATNKTATSQTILLMP